jgi:hypothetical protein
MDIGIPSGRIDLLPSSQFDTEANNKSRVMQTAGSG